jgi:large subunit ribosomal protein L21
MYAVVEVGGRQWRVEPGTQLTVNRIGGDVGSAHVVEQVLLASDGTAVQIGKPYCRGAKVLCEVLEHARGPKSITYKFRRRENWRKTRGHRQPITKLLVKEITVG